MKTVAWWLSFATEEQSLGACVVEIVEGASPDEVIEKSRLLGINPGGQVAALEYPAEELAKELPRNLWHRLMSKEDWNKETGGKVRTHGELNET